MNTFTKINLIGFQAHETRTILLDKITTIVGPSDTGKSAIVRALRWNLLNKPDGSTFANVNCDKTRVTVFAHACKVTRLRTKSKNKYILNGKALVSFGRTQVPDQIKELLNVSDINFQLQHDPPFWFGESAGEVSKQLNSIADLSLMDDSQTTVGKSIRSVKAVVDQTTKEVQQREREHERYKHARKLKKDFDRINKLNERKETQETTATTIEEMIEEAEENRTIIKFNAQRIELIKTKLELAEAKLRSHKLSNLIEQAKTSSAILKKVVPDSQAFEHSYKAFIAFEYNLANLIKQITQRKAELCNAEKTIIGIQQSLPDQCPTCGQGLTYSMTNAHQ